MTGKNTSGIASEKTQNQPLGHRGHRSRFTASVGASNGDTRAGRAAARRPGARRSAARLAWALLLIPVVLAACKNPLVTDIAKAVEVVVTPPGIESVFPVEDAANIPINLENLSITLSKPVATDSVTSSSVVITAPDGTSVSGVLSISSATTITFQPNQQLAYGTTYRVTITTAVRDIDGNALPESYSWSFTTGAAPDTTPPTETSIEVNGGAEWTTSRTVSLGLAATDDTAVAQMNVSNANSFPDAGWNTYQESLQWELDEGDGEKTVFVKFRDGAGNFTDSVSDTIRLDTTKPQVTSLTLNQGKPGTNTQAIPVTIVAADADGSSGVTQYRIRFEGEDWQAWSPLELGIGEIPSLSLPVALGESITIEAQARDLAGNESEVAAQSIVYEQDPPTVTTVSPGENESGVPANATLIRVVFSEAIDEDSIVDGDENPALVLEGASGTPVPGVQALVEDGTVLELSDLELEQNADYTVQLAPFVVDTAGNQLQAEKTWYFRTGDANDETPPAVETFSLVGGVNATLTTSVTLEILATDEYNSIRGIKLWGDSDGSRPMFEDDPAALWEPYTTAVNWTLPAGDGDKYIYARFMDSAENATETPVRLKISLDTTAPTVTAVSIDEDDPAYTNNQDRLVTLFISADDGGGSGIQEMMISNDASFTDASWESWSPIRRDWVLPEGDGAKTVYVKVRDFVDLESAAASDSITLDLTPPVVDLGPDDALNVNTATPIGGSYATDAESGIATYAWEQLSGPGSVAFDDPSIETPSVSADAEGAYQLKVFVTDSAGNLSFGTVGFTWDTTPPAETPAVEVVEYTGSAQPTWSWPAIDGADFYRVFFSDDPATTFDTDDTQFQPSVALLERAYTLNVEARDFAGNSTAAGSATTLVDVTAPDIPNDGSIRITNAPLSIFDATDPLNVPADPLGDDGTAGSGIVSFEWKLTDSPANGRAEFSDSASLNPLISFVDLSGPASGDGQYSVNLLVSDNAGNQTETTFFIQRDTEPPNVPTIEAPETTPSRTPRINWSSGGGGNGTFRLLQDGVEELIDTVTTYRPEALLDDKTTYEFTVFERDDAGNWSLPATAQVAINTEFRTSPEVWLEVGDNPTNASSITWAWSSGIGATETDDDYEYSFDSGTTWTRTTDNSVEQPLPSEGTYTFDIREYDGGVLVPDLVATRLVTVDRTPPSAPTVSSLDGRSATTNPQPTWVWSSNAPSDGTGVYRYRYDTDSQWIVTETTQTQFTAAAALQEKNTAGDHTLEVQERDEAGNWSASGLYTITVDRAWPVLRSITVWDPDSDVPADYAVTDGIVSYVVDADDEPDLEMQFYDYEEGQWGDWEPYVESAADYQLPSANVDGKKSIAVRLKDAVGNVTPTTVTDSITLDTVPPSVNSFSVRSLSSGDDAEYTGSNAVTISSSVSGAAAMQIANGTAPLGSWTTYNPSRSWYLNGGFGVKQVRARFKDAAGNVTATEFSDAIFYGNIYPTTVTKGQTSNGSITVRWFGYGSEFGSSVSAFVYTSTTPTGSKTYRGQTNAINGSFTFTANEGTLYYVHLLLRDSTIGYHPEYSNSLPGFSSDIVIIYDDDDANDVEIAGDMEYILSNDWWNRSPWNLAVSPSSFDPSPFTVTLLPDELVSTSYNTSVQHDTRVHGDPVILLPGADGFEFPNKARNIAFKGGRGIVAMGGGFRDGAYDLFNTVSGYYGSWGIDDPSYLVVQGGFTEANKWEYTWTSGNSVWRSPLTSTSLGGSNPQHNSRVQLSYQDLRSYSIYNPAGTHPPNGYNYGRADYSPTNRDGYFNVIRVGKYLLFGFDKLPDRPYTGWVYFFNLVTRMSYF